MTLIIRDAVSADIPAIASLYADEVRERVATYEYDVPDATEMERRRREIVAAGYPYLVAELDGHFAGYAYASAYRSRIGYRWTVENTVYIVPEAQRRGIGKALMLELIDQCIARGFRQMVAVIGEPGNGASVSLHRSLGFETVGIFRGLGRKHGRWLDTVQMQLALGPGDGTAPDNE